MAKWKSPKVRVIKNKLGTVIAVYLNGVKVPGCKSAALNFGSRSIPTLTLEILTQDFEVETSNTASLQEEA